VHAEGARRELGIPVLSQAVPGGRKDRGAEPGAQS
jgi:hypothetical protein